jgi:hypothetical protein
MARRKIPHSKNRPKTGPAARSAAGKAAVRKTIPGKAAPGLNPAGGNLGNIRDSIDAIDARIHGLLNERARFAQRVGFSTAASC